MKPEFNVNNYHLIFSEEKDAVDFCKNEGGFFMKKVWHIDYQLNGREIVSDSYGEYEMYAVYNF